MQMLYPGLITKQSVNVKQRLIIIRTERNFRLARFFVHTLQFYFLSPFRSAIHFFW